MLLLPTADEGGQTVSSVSPLGHRIGHKTGPSRILTDRSTALGYLSCGGIMSIWHKIKLLA